MVKRYKGVNVSSLNNSDRITPDIGYGLHYMRPDIFPPVRAPVPFAVKTHVIEDKIEKTITAGPDGSLAIYYCPMSGAWDSIRLGKMENNQDIYWSADSYVWYADSSGEYHKGSNTAGYSYNTSYDKFNSPAHWRNSVQGVEVGNHFKKIKITAGFLKMFYYGKEDDIQGIFKISMGFRQFNNSLWYDAVKEAHLNDFPVYKIQNAKNPLYCRHVTSDPDFNNFGPYTPYKSIPYYIIIGEGLPQNGKFWLEASRTIEGIISPSLSSLVNSQKPTKHARTASDQQKDADEHVGPVGHTDPKVNKDNAENGADALKKGATEFLKHTVNSSSLPHTIKKVINDGIEKLAKSAGG